MLKCNMKFGKKLLTNHEALRQKKDMTHKSRGQTNACLPGIYNPLVLIGDRQAIGFHFVRHS